MTDTRIENPPAFPRMCSLGAPETVTYRCIRCEQIQRGRFTCGETVNPNGWSQHRDKRLHWICWKCLPYGKGIRPPEPPDPWQQEAQP